MSVKCPLAVAITTEVMPPRGDAHNPHPAIWSLRADRSRI